MLYMGRLTTEDFSPIEIYRGLLKQADKHGEAGRLPLRQQVLPLKPGQAANLKQCSLCTFRFLEIQAHTKQLRKDFLFKAWQISSFLLILLLTRKPAVHLNQFPSLPISNMLISPRYVLGPVYVMP